MRSLLPLAVLALLVVLVLLVRQYAVARAERPRELEASRARSVVDAVNERAWTDRDVAPALAGALIERIREARAGGVPDLSLLDELREIDGDVSFFENFAITLQKPEPPQAVKDALIDQQEAVAKAKAAEAEASAKQKAAQAQVAVEKAEAAKIQERIKVLGREGYLKQYAIDRGLNPYQPSTNGLITQQP